MYEANQDAQGDKEENQQLLSLEEMRKKGKQARDV